MNKRKRMYHSNTKARNYLLYEYGASDVWFKRHTRRKDRVFTPKAFYLATDLFNLFDGIALVPDKMQVVFFQVKTDQWIDEKKFIKFKEKYPHITILVLNVKKIKGRYDVFPREFQ